ncbi:MAG: cytochrome d ubiquinol oxidase subunit II [Chloroflexota bacterium]
MTLNTLWFLLIAVLYLGFFLLEGFDFGVGMLLPFLGNDKDEKKRDLHRRTIINTIGPHWDGNEVWLLTAGGATFAAFPHWYATLFSGFYLALFLLLLALIVRGVAFEFRSKDDHPLWRKTWDWCIFVGSFLPALLLGVAFANLVKGVPIDQNMQYVGTFFDLLNPYGLIGGITSVLVFSLYGALFLSLKTSSEVQHRAEAAARRLWLPAVIALGLLFGGTYIYTDILTKLGVNPGVIPVLGAMAFIASFYFLRKDQYGWAFALIAVAIAFALVTEFMILYPRVMISSLNPAWSLTIDNASSSPYTLRVMTIIAVIFVPVVLLYQGWSYWVFRKRIQSQPEDLTY